jgi:hypothetical protein
MSTLLKVNRLIGPEGLYIYPLTYKDANDVSEEERIKHKAFFAQSDAYKKARHGLGEYYSIGTNTKRNFCVYAYKGDKFVGSTILKEFLDNPDGYGERDFFYTKWIYPDFEQRKESRHMSGDLFYMLFMSNIADRMYSYAVGGPDTISRFFFDKVDVSAPCMPNRYASDNIMLQKYISVKKEFESNGQKYIILNFDGNEFRKLDHLGYFMAPGGPLRTREKCEEMIRQMDKGVEMAMKYAGTTS